MDDKIIVSNRSALTRKYGSAGVTKIKAAIDALIAADGQRGIRSSLVYLDNAAAMKRFKGRAVTDYRNARQNKEAIDAIFRRGNPEYLMILGAPDVVPHQDLANPAFDPNDPNDDPDRQAPGDLPYACDAPYSRDVATFRGPTRVVGRLPDLTGAREPSYVIAVLGVAAKYKTRKTTDYGTYFGLSTHSWRNSTALSLFNVFGGSNAITLAPPSGPTHSAARLAPLAHFINCHGAPSTPEFYGERGNAQPVSLTSKGIKGKIKPGTVAAVECCYGGELYDCVTLASDLPICQNYLRQGAYGYFGSTTIAYGPADGNGAADLITQYFLLSMLDGASLGRAALNARQRFVQQTAELDPVDLKTLAQFNLLGDPSIHAAAVDSPTGLPKNVDAADAVRQLRRERRGKLRQLGEFLRETKPTASRREKNVRKSASVRQALSNIAREAGIVPSKGFTAYAVKAPPAGRAGAGRKAAPLASRYHVTVAFGKNRSRGTDGRRVAVVAKEVSGRIVGYRIYTEK